MFCLFELVNIKEAYYLNNMAELCVTLLLAHKALSEELITDLFTHVDSNGYAPLLVLVLSSLGVT